MCANGIMLFMRALRGNVEAASLLMKNFKLPVVLQRVLIRTRNVEVQSIVAMYTKDLPKLVFQFNTETDLDKFEHLCVHSNNVWHRHMFSQLYKARVLKSIRSDIHQYSF